MGENHQSHIRLRTPCYLVTPRNDVWCHLRLLSRSCSAVAAVLAECVLNNEGIPWVCVVRLQGLDTETHPFEDHSVDCKGACPRFGEFEK